MGVRVFRRGRGEAEKTSASEARRVEARWLARLVRSRLDAGWLVRDRRRRGGASGACGDVAFLFRTMTNAAEYERALAAEGLEFHVVGGSGFYALQEIQDVVNLLSVLEDPLDEVSLAGVLRSPFFGLSDEALFWIGGAGSRPRTLALGSSPARRSRDSPGSTAYEWLRRASCSSWLVVGQDHLSIARLLDTVLFRSGYEAALAGRIPGRSEATNARARPPGSAVRRPRRILSGGFRGRLRADLRRPPRGKKRRRATRRARASA
ncbi:MAG: 3'-5' exonuclease [Isosphaeraceae bacterium]